MRTSRSSKKPKAANPAQGLPDGSWPCKRWFGRAREDCKFGPGDIVRIISTGQIGIIADRPPSLEFAKGVHLDKGDDVYYVGLLDEGGVSFHGDHSHSCEEDLVLVVSLQIRKALVVRRQLYLQGMPRKGMLVAR